MPPRRRSDDTAGLPPNLYRHANGGFKYRDPRNSRWHYWPLSDSAAIAKAEGLNAQLPSKRRDSISNVIAKYLVYLEAETNNKASTLAVKRNILDFYARAFREFSIRDLPRSVLVEHWESIGPHGWLKHRTVLIDLYRYAIARGLCDQNEAEKTLPPRKLGRVRLRHTEAGIAAVYAVADEWLKIAIDVAIYTLQDRSTIAAAKCTDVTWAKDGFGRWVLTRSKTGANLAIKLVPGSKAETAIRRALEYKEFGSYLIRHKPKKRSRRLREFTQVTPGYLTKAFAEARDRSGAYDHLTPEERPSLHDLRAYGSWLYGKAGYPINYVQALMAHASAKMSEAYQAGHSVEYDDVEAGL